MQTNWLKQTLVFRVKAIWNVASNNWKKMFKILTQDKLEQLNILNILNENGAENIENIANIFSFFVLNIRRNLCLWLYAGYCGMKGPPKSRDYKKRQVNRKKRI